MFSLTLQLSIGKFVNIPLNERSLEKGLWWIPYALWPLEATLIGICFILLIMSAIFFTNAFRLLIITPKHKWNYRLYDGVQIAPGVLILFYAVWRLVMGIVKNIVYHSIGLELSTVESILNTIVTNRYLHYVGLAVFGFFSINHLDGLRNIEKLCNPMTAITTSLSLFRFSGSLVSFIPLSLFICSKYTKKIFSKVTDSNKFDLVSLGLGMSLGLIGLGYLSYLTLAPATLILLTLILSESLL